MTMSYPHQFIVREIVNFCSSPCIGLLNLYFFPLSLAFKKKTKYHSMMELTLDRYVTPLSELCWCYDILPPLLMMFS